MSSWFLGGVMSRKLQVISPLRAAFLSCQSEGVAWNLIFLSVGTLSAIEPPLGVPDDWFAWLFILKPFGLSRLAIQSRRDEIIITQATTYLCNPEGLPDC